MPDQGAVSSRVATAGTPLRPSPYDGWEAAFSEAESNGVWRTASGLPVAPLYLPDSQVSEEDYARKLGYPGAFPFTRGPAAAMYREGPWVMGMYSGRASPSETRRRILDLLTSGQTGFSIALDLPTQVGRDSDDPLAGGEVGRVGVPIDSLRDMEDLLRGVPLNTVQQIRTTANAIGPIAVALFVAASESLGYSPDNFKLLLQNDVLKEYVARGTQIFPPERGLQFSVDAIEYCARELPHWEPIEFCGYHIRDSGSTAVQEVAIAMANALEYIDATHDRGLPVASFIGNAYMFLSAHLDLFEEVAKFRATRRLWAKLMKDRYRLDESTQALKIFCYTLGSLQSAKEPLNNLIRIAYQALAAALGGVQTLATSAFDEALRVPSSGAAHLGLRTQQILAFETGVTRTIDPLGGSYFLEQLTDRLEESIMEYLGRINQEGGALGALRSGFIAREIEASAFDIQKRIDSGDITIVGQNAFETANPPSVLLEEQARDNADYDEQQRRRLHRLRRNRDNVAVMKALDGLRDAVRHGKNTVEPILGAVRSYATVGEICSVLKSEWGSYDANGTNTR